MKPVTLLVLCVIVLACTPTAISLPPDADAARAPQPPVAASDARYCTRGCDCACDVLQANHCAAGGIVNGATCYQRCEVDRKTPGAMPVACVEAATTADAIRACGVACL